MLRYIKKNFIWKLENITPSYRPEIALYRYLKEVAPRNASGSARLFEINWNGSNADVDISCGNYRIAHHSYQLDVYYPTAIARHEDINAVITSDRNDIIKSLNISANDSRLGYSDNHSTDEIGLLNRIRVRDEIKKDNDILIYSATFECTIKESEV